MYTSPASVQLFLIPSAGHGHRRNGPWVARPRKGRPSSAAQPSVACARLTRRARVNLKLSDRARQSGVGGDGTHKMLWQSGWEQFVHTVVVGGRRSDDPVFQLSSVVREAFNQQALQRITWKGCDLPPVEAFRKLLQEWHRYMCASNKRTGCVIYVFIFLISFLMPILFFFLTCH